MSTDNRTNELTPEQIEAAAVASINSHRSRAGLQALAALDGVPNADEWRADARAALVAAQGAAPRADGAPKSSYISPNLPGMIRNLWKSDPSENSVRTALKLAGDLIQELIDLKAAPVLSSSGVDEESLRPFLKNLIFQYNQERVTLNTATRYLAEWLKGQGGESRGDR